MTTTEVLDPWAHVLVGTQVNNRDIHPGFNHEPDAMWTRERYTWCAQLGPTTGKACSRPRGHAPNLAHMACSDEGGSRAVLHERWVDENPAQTELSADPHFSVNVGDAVDLSDAPDAARYGNDSGLWCAAVNPQGGVGMCTRAAGHDNTWRHISVNAARLVTNVWGGGPVGSTMKDPFEGHLSRGTWYRDFGRTYPSTDDPAVGLNVPRNQCGDHCADYPTDYPCTRPMGHPGVCCHCRYDQIQWAEQLHAVAVPSQTHDPIPPDGSPVDPEETVYTTAAAVGDVVKLRDRDRRLYVMGTRRGTAQIEALDLTTSELWAVPIDRTVKLSGDDALISASDLTVITQWYSTHRENVRDVAIREYLENGRWCMEGLNQHLGTLGLPQYEPKLRGTVSFTVSFSVDDTTLTRSTITNAVNEALKASPMVFPSVDLIKITGEPKIKVSDLSRK